MNIQYKVHAQESCKYNFSICVGALTLGVQGTEENMHINVRIGCAYTVNDYWCYFTVQFNALKDTSGVILNWATAM